MIVVKTKMTAAQRRCWNVAKGHLARGTQEAFDMCAETGQMLGNIKHTRMAVAMMANWLIDNTSTHAALVPFKA